MLTLPQKLAENVREVRARIAGAAAGSGRNVDSITLLAVSKGQTVESIEAAARCGLEHFGENYLQEALPKLERLRGLELTWHFIGPLQSNKTKPVAESFAWVHTVDRLKVAERLSKQRPHYAPDLNVCIQVNVADEATKSGVTPTELPALVAGVRALPRLRLRGLMTLPPAEEDPQRQRHWFARLRELAEQLSIDGCRLDTLSMGMSGDLESAVAEGATIVRVGTALFGPRSG